MIRQLYESKYYADEGKYQGKYDFFCELMQEYIDKYGFPVMNTGTLKDKKSIIYGVSCLAIAGKIFHDLMNNGFMNLNEELIASAAQIDTSDSEELTVKDENFWREFVNFRWRGFAGVENEEEWEWEDEDCEDDEHDDEHEEEHEEQKPLISDETHAELERVFDRLIDHILTWPCFDHYKDGEKKQKELKVNWEAEVEDQGEDRDDYEDEDEEDRDDYEEEDEEDEEEDDEEDEEEEDYEDEEEEEEEEEDYEDEEDEEDEDRDDYEEEEDEEDEEEEEEDEEDVDQSLTEAIEEKNLQEVKKLIALVEDPNKYLKISHPYGVRVYRAVMEQCIMHALENKKYRVLKNLLQKGEFAASSQIVKHLKKVKNDKSLNRILGQLEYI